MKKGIALLTCLFFALAVYSQDTKEKVKIKNEKIVTVDVRKDGDVERNIKIVMDEDGDERVIEWSDDGEIPEDVLKKLEEAGVDIKILSDPGDDHEIMIDVDVEDGDGNYMFITTDDDEVIGVDGEKKIIIMKDGDDVNFTHPRKHKMRIHKGKKGNLWTDDEDNVFMWKGDGKHKGMKVHGKGGNVMFFGDDHGSKMTDAYMGAHIGGADAGVEILELIKDGPADKAGLQVGDVIQEINGANTESVDDLMTLLRFFDPGDKIDIDIQREGKDRSVSLELAKRPDHQK